MKKFIKYYGLSIFITIFFSAVIAQMILLHGGQSSPFTNLLANAAGMNTEYNPGFDKNLGTNVPFDELQPSLSSSLKATAPSDNSPAGEAHKINTANFTAVLQNIRQDSVKYTCDANNKKDKNCSKQYTFIATINTQNGPGNVHFAWQVSLRNQGQNGDVRINDALATRTISKTITLPCQSPATFTVQLALTSPSQQQSQSLTVTHNCAQD